MPVRWLFRELSFSIRKIDKLDAFGAKNNAIDKTYKVGISKPLLSMVVNFVQLKHILIQLKQ